MTFTAVVTCHDASPKAIIENLATQTRRPDEILIFLSADKQALEIGRWSGARLRYFLHPNKNDWGHAKRALGLSLATGEFIGFFNHDDAYEPDYLERLLDAAQDADVAYCNWTWGQRDYGTVGNCEFRAGNSTSGNWIGRTALVRQAGYHGRDYSADGTLIDRVAALKPRVVKVDAVLYHHNP